MDCYDPMPSESDVYLVSKWKKVKHSFAFKEPLPLTSLPLPVIPSPSLYVRDEAE